VRRHTSKEAFLESGSIEVEGGYKMFKWEMKIKFKSLITVVIITLICAISLMSMQLIEEKRSLRDFSTKYATDSFIFLNQMKWEDDLSENDKVNYPKSEYTYRLYDSVRNSIWNLSYSDNYNEMNRLQSFLSLLTLRNEFDANNEEVVQKSDVLHTWTIVSAGIPYDDVDFYVKEKGEADFPKNMFLLQAKYFESLFIKNIRMIFDDELSNISYLYNMYDQIVPICTILLSFYITYPTISRSYRNGQIKMLLNAGQKRTNIYFARWLSNIIYVWLLIIPPTIVMSFVAGIKGYMTSNCYPMVILSNPLSRVSTIPNYFDIAVNNGRYANLYPNAIGRTAPLGEYFMYGGDISDSLEIIPFIEFILLVIVLISLFICFLVAFIQLFSILFNHEFIALISSGIVYGICYVSSGNFMQGEQLNLSPFTFFSAVRIIEGVHNTTFLLSTISLITSTLILVFVGNLLFAKKEI